jgi:FlgD Ig-like domain
VFTSFRRLNPVFRRSCGLLLAFIALALFAVGDTALAQTGKLFSSNTKKGYSKSNQSKVFFHDGSWWALAFNKSASKWYVWKYSADTWTANAAAGNISSSDRPDVVLEAAANKLYLIFSSSNTPEFYRMSYSGGTWSIDAGFPKSLSAFAGSDSKDPVSLVRAANGELWLFRVLSSILEGMRSTDNGNTWSAKFTIKSPLNYKKSTTDAKAFSMGGQNYIGLAYGEELKSGKSHYGFLYHHDGDATTTWTDESVALTLASGINATGGINLAVDASNNLYLFTQNGNASGTNAGNTLYKRAATTGLWQVFNVNVSETWTSPAIAVQGSSNLFLMGINTATSKAQYKTITIGQENLAASTFANPLFDNGAEIFLDLSAPLDAVDGTTQLMVCIENNTAGKIWFNLASVSGGGGSGGGACSPMAALGQGAIPGTKGASGMYNKPNQNKVFFHDGAWWVAAPDQSNNGWYLWKNVGSSWTRSLFLNATNSIRPDCYVDSGNNKVYILNASSSNNGTQFVRATYANGDWTADAGFPVTLTGFTFPSEDACVLTRAKNGDFWAFVARTQVLYARHSTDGGQTWSGDIIVKNPLNEIITLCDAVAFQSNGQNYVGVGYAENTASNAVYGFLMHKDGNADNIWTDETSQLLPLPNAQADDHIGMAVSANNEIYLAVKTKKVSNSAAAIGGYKRAANGGWSSFTVSTSTWTRPAVVIDESNNEVYFFATLESLPRMGQYKKCAIGNEASLATAAEITFLQNASDEFYNVSVPAHRVTSCTGLMVTAENSIGAQIWFKRLAIGTGGPQLPAPVSVANVTVTPATAGQNAAYSTPITLGAINGLTGGSSTITVVWPNDTNVPVSMANTMVTVNGVNAASVTTTPANRQAIVTVPNNVAGGATVTLAFAAGAGLVNPTTATNYTLTVQTSAQPIDATSPAYVITPAGVTPVTVGNVTVTPATAGQGAAYSIPLTLGATNGLTGGSSTISVVWPTDTSIPVSMSNTTVKVNGVNATGVTTTPASRQAVVTVPSNIAGGATVTLAFAAGAGLVNPTTAANYTLAVQTSAQPVDATSPAYTITPAGVAPVSVGTVVLTTDVANTTAGYTIPLTLGASGALTGGTGTITITWPNDTVVPASIASNAVTVNGANASAVVTNPAARQATVTVPANLAGSALVTLLFKDTAGLKNPTTSGNYTLQAQTSAQAVNAASPSYTITPSGPSQPPGGNFSSVLATRTKSTYDKSSQSKVFYLDNKWWTIAQDSIDSKWYIYGGNTPSASWVRGLKIDSRGGARADVIVDPANNRLYILFSQGTTSYFYRLLYAVGNWTLETQVALAGFNYGDGTGVVTMARAKNNNLWIFRINNNILEAQVSTNDGSTWSATMQLKTGLSSKYGQTDAVAFSAGGNYVGVVYGLAASLGGTQFGFLKHLDSDPNTTWTDETAQLTFFGTESSDNWVSANATSDGTVYVITRNNPGAAGVDPTNTLYKRSGNTWSKFKVNTSTTWASPTLAIDGSNNNLFVMGIRTTAPNIGEYKWCGFGNEGSLESATPTVLLQHNADNFGDLSAPQATATNATGLLIVGSNVTTDDLWYAKISLGAPKNAAHEAEIEQQRKLETTIDNFAEVQLYPNPFNPATTIRFAVKEPATVKLHIFNINGELVRTLADGEFNRGLYEKRWNGLDNTGRQAASGMYFYRLQIGAKVFNGRMQMLK